MDSSVVAQEMKPCTRWDWIDGSLRSVLALHSKFLFCFYTACRRIKSNISYHLKMMLLWFQCFLHRIREFLEEYQASFGEVLIILSACWYLQSSDCQEKGHLSAACGKCISHMRWGNPNTSTEDAATRDRMIFMLIIYRLRKQTNKIFRRFLRHRKRVSFKLASHECVKICELMFFSVIMSRDDRLVTGRAPNRAAP